MSLQVKLPFEVPFHDVDSLGMVWHGHYYKYFELARTELYRSLGFDIADMIRLGFDLPVIESQCRYGAPLRYGQRCEVSARFREWQYYLLIGYRISDADSGKRLAHGHTKQAICDRDGHMHASVPEAIIELLGSQQS